ncbi:hypothetical protein F2Q69_00051066 [Brassica cretica]|uniref:Uncharacterized protein n=1 Tax=Brassica cretica TaxID=69181 RepID=A0A8S9PS12_BRACR|nr:hypothetical protein F2Q69_00051066 [Brassica cretica]
MKLSVEKLGDEDGYGVFATASSGETSGVLHLLRLTLTCGLVCAWVIKRFGVTGVRWVLTYLVKYFRGGGRLKPRLRGSLAKAVSLKRSVKIAAVEDSVLRTKSLGSKRRLQNKLNYLQENMKKHVQMLMKKMEKDGIVPNKRFFLEALEVFRSRLPGSIEQE